MKTKDYKMFKNKEKFITVIDCKRINGYKVLPKNTFEYPGIAVDSMILIKPIFIEKILKKKIKRKLDLYLQYIISLMDESSDDSTFREALNEMSKYRDIVEYKYRLFLDDKYINLLLKKLSLLEHEIKSKQAYVMPKKETKKYKPIIEPVVEEEVRHKSR